MKKSNFSSSFNWKISVKTQYLFRGLKGVDDEEDVQIILNSKVAKRF